MNSRTCLRALAVPALLVLAACSSAPADPDPSPLPDLPSPALVLERVWRTDVGKGPGVENGLRPAPGAQQVVAASHDGVLMAVATDTGKVLWRQKTGLGFSGGVAQGYGQVLAGTSKGELHAFDAADGKARWKVALGAAVLAAPALSAERVVVVAADGVVHALDRESGQSQWTYRTPVPPLSLRGNPSPLIVDNELVLVPTASGKIVSLDLANGIVAWEVRVASNTGRSELERMVDLQAGLLMAGNGDLFSVGFQSQLTALDVQAGRRRWQYEISSVKDMAEGLGSVYAVDTGSTLHALDQKAGKPVWKQPALAWRQLTAPVVLGDVVVVGDGKGYLHLLAQSDGRVLGRARSGSEPLDFLTVQDERLYVWARDGQLSAWRLRGD
ncbi:MAG: outer membrane protein assembly factor BamB [Moraxellaceae bacterium]|nr:outer membrane protein assembly factor BamB [Moraxellaceae bacterium]